MGDSFLEDITNEQCITMHNTGETLDPVHQRIAIMLGKSLKVGESLTIEQLCFKSERLELSVCKPQASTVWHAVELIFSIADGKWHLRWNTRGFICYFCDLAGNVVPSFSTNGDSSIARVCPTADIEASFSVASRNLPAPVIALVEDRLF